MADLHNGYHIVQNGSQFFTAMCCSDDDGKPLSHLLIISGPFDSYAEADRKRRGQNV